jgi:hypothetical protein
MMKAKFVNEGTWALSKSRKKRQLQGNLCIKKINELKNFIYPIFGDDLLFDELDGVIKRIEELMAIPEEEIDESLNENLKIQGHEFKSINYKGQKIYLNKEGILGQHWLFIPWNIIEKVKESL